VTTHVSAPTLVVLHALRIAGRAPMSTLTELTGLPPSVIGDELAANSGLVVHHDGVMPGWSLTTAGRHDHAAQLAAERAAAGRDADLVAAYDDVIARNGWFKALCTEWQLHDHPRSCIQRLGDRHHEVIAICDRLSGAISRFGPYSPRFDAALIRLRAGDATALAKPLTGSYHDVWMHLHEDLLLTLDRPRSDLDEA
jgi:hypothetical protein